MADVGRADSCDNRGSMLLNFRHTNYAGAKAMASKEPETVSTLNAKTHPASLNTEPQAPNLQPLLP